LSTDRRLKDATTVSKELLNWLKMVRIAQELLFRVMTGGSRMPQHLLKA
jgi:hypothetical protein